MVDLGKAQAALFVLELASAGFDLRVDDLDQFYLTFLFLGDTHDEQAAGDGNLVGRQPESVGIGHGLVHVIQQRDQRLVERLDRLTATFEHRRWPGHDGTFRHDEPPLALLFGCSGLLLGRGGLLLGRGGLLLWGGRWRLLYLGWGWLRRIVGAGCVELLA